MLLIRIQKSLKEINSLPSSGGLVESAFGQMCSQYCNGLMFLESLNTFQMYQMLRNVHGNDSCTDYKHLEN